jgi:hypothetical protein
MRESEGTVNPVSPASLHVVDRLRGETRRLVRRRSRAVDVANRDLEHAETIDFIVAELQHAVASDRSGHIGAIATVAIQRALLALHRSKSRHGRAGVVEGVETIDVRPSAAGGAVAQVAGSKRMELAPALARLLCVLTQVEAGADGFCGWLSVEAVADAIAQKGGPKPTRRAIAQLVFRLRNLLECGNAGRWLVQADRRLGLRFLLRKHHEQR